MERLNDELDRPRMEMEKLIQILQDGEKRIQDCSRCYRFQRIWYPNKIRALNACLLRFFRVDVHAQVGRDVEEILAILKSIRFNWNYRGVSDEYENLGSCNAPGPPEFMVGLDVALKELKRWLFTDGESRIVVSAPGGCGKTTLAKRLCHDQQVKEYFQHIFYVTVSKTCNLIGIIKKLFWHNDEQTIMVTGFTPQMSPEQNMFSTDNSPLHNPTVKSPRVNPRSPSGTASPLHQKIPLETSTARRENNSHANIHRLPLPPGVVAPPQASSIHPVIAKTESFPMTTQWQKGKLIGRGTFGSVYVATNRETGALCAMKEVELFPDDPKSAECVKQLEQEIKILSQLKHPNIVQYFGSETVEDRLYIYLEYVHPGSINKYVREHCGAITESVVRNFTCHILSGLAYLHSTKTIHRDIKGANLLVDASGVVKLADFGMSKHLTGAAADLSLKGSPYWMAPELMQAEKDNSSDLAFAVDIWSLGCTVIEMLNGKPPWSEYEGAAAMFKVMRESPPIPETLSSEGKDFLRCCFRRNPAERPPAIKLLEHRFVKNSTQLDVPLLTQTFSGMKFL
ncbi:hypothetical protein PVL29_026514 [Vitis rotundifolia]|uniref:mitogen-activated protein kinase kinase kinase n=2 Tax=Vitis rotundifolia TaxID=103349 RepID=A0AA38YGF9_VITRO|nr:hypothetical protein PVL29_026514 [Vitis rotundifolia]